jgi:hypothetical protein
MKKSEAEKLIGKLVITSYVNGVRYIGELIEIIPSKPFRANVKIKAIYEYPWLYSHHSRGGFDDYKISLGNKVLIPKNEIVNIGNDIKLFDNELLPYEESIVISIQKYMNEVKQTVVVYIEHNGKFSSCYIFSLADSQKLYNILIQRFKDAQCLI